MQMRIIRTLLTGAALLAAIPASASFTSTGGSISWINAVSNGVVLFDIDGARSTPPACQAVDRPSTFAISVATAAGQAQLATLLTAHALKKRVRITGFGDCRSWSDIEAVDYVIVEN